MHFQKPTVEITRGKEIEGKINKFFQNNKLGEFEKNQKVFEILLPFQGQAIKNARQVSVKKYEDINWQIVLDEKGNSSTSIHFLIDEINSLIGDAK